MMRLLLSVVVGLVGAGLVHISAIFLVPRVSENNAWSRLSDLGAPYEVVRISALRDTAAESSGEIPTTAGRNAFAYVDPAFVVAGCRFSLADGPIAISADGSIDEFWSASIYDRQGDNYYSINDRAAIDGVVDLVIGTQDQIRAIDAVRPFAQDGTTLPVVVTMNEGYMTLRILIDTESKRPTVDAFLRTVTCEPIEDRRVALTPNG